MKVALRACKYLLLLCLIAYLPVSAQTLSPNTITFPFNSESIFNSGASQSFNNQLSYTALLSLVLTLEVKASGNLTFGSNSIPISDFQLQVTSINGNVTVTGSNNLITLSNVNQVLSSGINLGLASTVNFTLNYTALGGTNFFVPAGTYSTTLTFTLTNLLLFSKTVTATLSVNIANTSSITLQNGGNTATLRFASATDYQNGVQLTQGASLNAFSTQPYHISVNASQNLMNGANYIPINNIYVKALPSTVNTSITSTPLPLSLSLQNLVGSTAATLSQNFDITYYTLTGNNAFLNKPSGTYNSTLTYTITSP